MASLACMLHDIGHQVSGSDIAKHIFTEDELRKRNIPIHDFNQVKFENDWTVVVGNAFLDTFDEVMAAKANPTIKVVRYHDFLGELMKQYFSIAISGSHGKTTTTSMIAAMLTPSKKTGYLIGDGMGKLSKDDQYLVIEACEYRRHFLSYFPNIAVVTNVDLDHIDYFKDEEDYIDAFNQFLRNIKDTSIIFGDDPKSRSLNPTGHVLYYGLNADNDLVAANIIEHQDKVSFECLYQGKTLGRITLPFVGHHMIQNSLASIAVGLIVGLSIDQIVEGLTTFRGAKRRFVIEQLGEDIYVDDYAHHPTEIAMTIKAAKTRYPEQTIVAIFKPHRVSRLFTFADQFASALSLADHVALCDFNSIDDFEEGYDIDIRYLQNKIPGAIVVSEDENGAAALARFRPAVYLFMNSKDIYVLSDYSKRYQKS